MEVIDEIELAGMSPKEFRSIVADGKWKGSTMNACREYVQANLVIVPQNIAFDFLLFCIRNPKPCPILEVGDPGDPYTKLTAMRADITTDLPRYQILENGKVVAEPTDIREYWKDDYVFYLLGCSLSFEWLLKAADIRYRFIGTYKSNIQAIPAGQFAGYYVVTCRLFRGAYDAIRAVEITTRYPRVHGGPVHIGDPATIGIEDLYHPLRPVSPSPIEPMAPDEVPLFWACGVTPREIATEVKLPLMITHGVGRLFVTDWLTRELT